MKDIEKHPTLSFNQEAAELADTIKILEYRIQVAQQRGDKKYRDEKIAEQQAIIAAAQQEIQKLENDYQSSAEDIKSIERRLVRERKRLLFIKNREAIAKVMKLKEKLDAANYDSL